MHRGDKARALLMKRWRSARLGRGREGEGSERQRAKSPTNLRGLMMTKAVTSLSRRFHSNRPIWAAAAAAAAVAAAAAMVESRML